VRPALDFFHTSVGKPAASKHIQPQKKCGRLESRDQRREKGKLSGLNEIYAPNFDYLSAYRNAAERSTAKSKMPILSANTIMLLFKLDIFCGGDFRRRVYITVVARWVSPLSSAFASRSHPLFQTFGSILHLAICN
jgi:hypothetical protein